MALQGAAAADAAAGLSFVGDVFAVEPLPGSSGLWALPNALLSAHCADWTADTTERTATQFSENVARWVAGEELVGKVDPKLGY